MKRITIQNPHQISGKAVGNGMYIILNMYQPNEEVEYQFFVMDERNEPLCIFVLEREVFHDNGLKYVKHYIIDTEKTARTRAFFLEVEGLKDVEFVLDSIELNIDQYAKGYTY